MAERERWERTGQRRLRFDNGRSESYQAVAVPHEPSGEMWSRILIARDGGTLADRIASLPEIEARYDSLRAKVEAEVKRMRTESSDPQLNEFAQQQAQFDANRLSALLEETGS